MQYMRTTSITLAVSLLCNGFVHAAEVTLGDLKIFEPYTRAMASNAPVGAGYMAITNAGKADDRLISAQSDRAGQVAVHEMKIQNDVMIMREMQNGLEVPAGETVELKPGGYHIMYLKVPVPFKQGESVRTTLTFEKAGSITLDVPVAGLAGGKPASMSMSEKARAH